MEMVPDPLCFPEEGRKDQRDRPTGAVYIRPVFQQALGVKTSEVSRQSFGQNIRSYGEIVSSPRRARMVHLRSEGWVVDLATDAVGDAVQKGDLLFTLYSPELMNAQADYLLSLNTRATDPDLKNRLQLFGMDEKSIKALESEKKIMETTPFYAAAAGSISDLSVKKGAFVERGGHILSIQDYRRVWVNANVAVRDIQFLEVGTPATVTVPETGQKFKAEIGFIHPVSDPQSRTVPVRLVLDNPQGVIRPGLYVDTTFDARKKTRLAVPREAVLYGAGGAHIIEDIGDGYFRAVTVETGITSGGLTEITGGLSDGQAIVTSGQFMIDAESNLRGGMAAMGHGKMDHGKKQDPDLKSERINSNTSQDREASHVH